MEETYFLFKQLAVPNWLFIDNWLFTWGTLGMILAKHSLFDLRHSRPMFSAAKHCLMGGSLVPLPLIPWLLVSSNYFSNHILENIQLFMRKRFTIWIHVSPWKGKWDSFISGWRKSSSVGLGKKINWSYFILGRQVGFPLVSCHGKDNSSRKAAKPEVASRRQEEIRFYVRIWNREYKLVITVPLSCSIAVNNFPRLNSSITSSETDNIQDGINEIHLIGGHNILNN